MKIIRVPRLAHMPMGPRSLLGLANLRGVVVPVISLASLLRLPAAPLDDAARVIVTDGNAPVGFLVERIEKLLTLAAKEIEADAAGAGSIAPDLLDGTVKGAEGESKKSGSRAPGAVVTTIGGVGLAVGGIFGALAFSATSSAKSQCTGNTCPPSAADDISRSKTFGNVSTGLFIGGGAVAVTGIILLIAAPGGGGGKSDDARPSAGLTGVAPWAAAGSAGVGATGRF